MSNAAGPTHAKSIRALGRLCGRAESTVRKWLARDDWPFARTPPWDVARVRAWMDIHLKPDPAVAYRRKARAAAAGTAEFAGMGKLTLVRVQKTLEQTLALRQRRELDAGLLHSKADCLAGQQQLVLAARDALTRSLPRSLAAECQGRGRAEIERILRERLTAVCNGLAGEAVDHA